MSDSNDSNHQHIQKRCLLRPDILELWGLVTSDLRTDVNVELTESFTEDVGCLRRRKKLQAHLKESRGLKNYSVNHPCKAHAGLQLHNGFDSNPTSQVRRRVSPSSCLLARCDVQPSRSSPVSCNVEQKNRTALRLSARRTPPITGGRLNPIVGLKDSGPAYQHLQEAKASGRDREPARVNIIKPDATLQRDAFQASQPSEAWAPPLRPCFRSPGKRSLTPYRIPIIPSVHSHRDETSCMQTTSGDGMQQSIQGQEGTTEPGRADILGSKDGASVPAKEWEKLKAKTQDDTVIPDPYAAKETVCILLTSGTGHGGTTPSGPTETQLVNPTDMRQESTQPRQ
ncbi:hypothetical protein Baya_13021 [Bagarius yarrelli]|uniref:Uncharacterized protein n=1 Tax=Bagarius yarrelli TaxID=175774 RepID=A0A556V515_BAGYA|nr:hypothetical protein Baya_13021 [Bagarius yarrelli]